MLKIGNNVKIETRVVLPENWHEKIIKFAKVKDFPYEFTIEEIKKNKNIKETYYICKSIKKDKEKVVRLAFSEYAIKYLFAQEVADLNIGLSFKEFLPLDNTRVLITNVRNPSEVVPGIFKSITQLVKIEDKSYICMNFQIDFMNGKGFASVKYFTTAAAKATFKFLDNPDTSYMTEYEEMFRDTMIHKEYVIKSCKKLSNYLEKQGAIIHSKMLMERAEVHDNSKTTCQDELHALSRIINDKTSLMDSSIQLSPIKLDAVKLHWKHNSHHPEHYDSPIDMSKLDIMEMCCDWHARSMQYGTDFLKFVSDRQRDRFHFPDWMYSEIWHYCQILASEI